MRRAALGALGAACVLLVFPLAGHGKASSEVWSGTWSRAEDGVAGNLILVQTGNAVSGRYTWNDGSGRVSGTVAGSTFTGGFNETHYKGSFVLTLSGKSFTGSYNGQNKDTKGAISGPFDGACIAGPCLQNGASQGGGSSGSAAKAGALSGEITVVRADGTKETLRAGASLAKGDKLETGVDAHVTLSFPDGSQMTLTEMTVVQVADLTVQNSRQNVSVAVRLGDVSVQVHPTKQYQTDFNVVTQTTRHAAGGTRFSVFYDPGSHADITVVTEHTVIVDPTRPGLRTVTVPAGKEVEVTPAAVSPLAAIGKADARGGIDRSRAYALASSAVAKSAAACSLVAPATTAGFSVKPGKSGWLVTIPVSGKVTGLTAWTAAGSHAAPANALATRVAAGC